MENTKKNIKDLKKKIAEAAEWQKVCKEHRKTERFQGERQKVECWGGNSRVMTSDIATYKVQVQGEELRIMYAAYGRLRGKKYSEIENSYPEENHPLNDYSYRIGKLIEEYSDDEKETVCVD